MRIGLRPLQAVPAAPAAAPAIYSYRPSQPRVALVDPFLASWAERLAAAGDRPLDLDAWDAATRGPVAMDVEVYRNLFLVCFKRLSDGRRVAFERSDRSRLDAPAVEAVLRANTVVTFNGTHYDLPLLALALDGASTGDLKAASDGIVGRGDRPARRAGRHLVPDHVDLMEPNPSVRQGLKLLHARLHGRFLVDLPFAPDATLTHAQMNVVAAYCLNDLDATEVLWHALREPLALREALGREHGLDLRSRSDAQVGEAIVVRMFERRVRRRVGRPDNLGRPPRPFRYDPPPFVSFSTAALRGVVERLRSVEFRVDGGGEVVVPEPLAGLAVEVGGARYTMGIGGLHSREEHIALRSDAERALIDVDVSSQYPRIISRLGAHPPALGPEFVEVYSSLIEQRLAAKLAGDRTTSDGLKIATNGCFGKLGSVQSALYSPRLMVATTLTGQLSILMLIESATEAGVDVVSANTDGVTFLCRRDREPDLDRIVASWEAATGFEVEHARYRSLHSASVNSYVAIREDGSDKRRGPLADPWSSGYLRGQMSKNPQMTVVSEAVLRHLRDGTPVGDTVDACRDPRMFVTVIKATGGATWRGVPIGRVVRYYWSTDGDPVLYATAKRRVARTKGARPMLEMTDAVPADLDRDRYRRAAEAWLVDLGVQPEGGLL